MIPTTVERKISEKIAKTIQERKNEILIQGPIGIGKSHALLAETLKLRKKGKSIVVYINNPSNWQQNKYVYIIKEIIYAMMPFQATFDANPPLSETLLPKEDSLFRWYYVLMLLALLPLDLEQSI